MEQEHKIEKEYPDSAKEILFGLPKRALALLWKLVSLQGIVLCLGTWLVWMGRIESYAWLVVCCFVLFGRYALDVVREIRK